MEIYRLAIILGLSVLIYEVSTTAISMFEKKREIIEISSPVHGKIVERYLIHRDKENNKPIKDGKYIQYFYDGSFKIVGKYKKDMKDGKWKYYGPDGNKFKEEKYKKGELKEEKLFDEK
jgi:antitoxin component YwqK of YwqJK toxin-antitoxin module